MYTMEDFKGQDYIDVVDYLRKQGITQVEIEEKVLETDEEFETDRAVIDQEPKAGTEISEDDKVTLYRMKVYDKYPDMVEEGWTVDQVEAFCEQNNLKLTIDYEKTNQYTPGMIISQSRKAGTTLVKGVDFRITIAMEPDNVGEPQDPTQDLKPQEDPDNNEEE